MDITPKHASLIIEAIAEAVEERGMYMHNGGNLSMDYGQGEELLDALASKTKTVKGWLEVLYALGQDGDQQIVLAGECRDLIRTYALIVDPVWICPVCWCRHELEDKQDGSEIDYSFQCKCENRPTPAEDCYTCGTVCYVEADGATVHCPRCIQLDRRDDA